MMANKRSVDPDALEPSVKIVGIRVTQKQLGMIAELCEVNNCSRSELFRRMLNFEHAQMQEPEPF